MRQEVSELGELGPLPPSDVAVRDNLQHLLDKYASLIGAIEGRSLMKRRGYWLEYLAPMILLV